MSRFLAPLVAFSFLSVGCSCGIQPVQDCNGMPCPDGGGAGGSAGGSTAGGSAGGTTAGGDAGGSTAGGSTAGGDAGGTAGGDAGGSTAGGDAGGSTAGGSTAGGSTAGGATAGGAAGGAIAGGAAGGSTAGGATAGGATAGGATAGGATGDGGMAYDACGEYARRQCDFLIRCSTTGLQGFNTNDQVASSQRTACEAIQRAQCDEQQGALNRGRTSVNVAAFRTCLDAIFPSNSCLRDRNLSLSVCDESAYTTALAAPGTVCANDIECANGFCNSPQGSTCGTCSLFRNAADGGTTQFCTRDGQCAPSTYCRQGACVPRNGLDAGCAGTTTCAQGLICPDPAAPQRFCQVGKPEGASCVKGRLECARSGSDFELVCATQFTADGGVDRCTKRFNTSPGGACNTGEQVGGTGVPAAPTCLETEYCDNGICTNRRAIGQPCSGTNDICVAGSRCSNSTCTAFADLGGACTQNGSTAGCRELLYCSNLTCQPQFVSTGGCTNNGNPQCVPQSTYCPFTGGGMMAMCVATKPNGQTCMADRECAGGDCVGGMCANLCYR